MTDWEGAVRVEAEGGLITIDDPYWCPACGYRSAGVTYDGLAPAFTEGSDGGPAPTRVRPAPETPNRPGLVLVTTSTNEGLVEVTALTLPPGDFAARSFCVRETPSCD